MSSYRDIPNEFDASATQATAAPTDVADAIGYDERRMYVRAYNYWISLLHDRDFPSIEDLEPAEVEDFGAQSVLLDFTCGRDNPAMPYVGSAIREECELTENMRTVSDVPGRSLLSRLTDHYLQIIANRAPIGFEAEFENQRGESICYRGILMPFSSDGDTIDFIYGVINWKQVDESPEAIDSVAAEEAAGMEIAGIADTSDVPFENVASSEEEDFLELTEPFETASVDEDAASPEGFGEPISIGTEAEADPVQQETAPVHFSWEDGPLADDADVPAAEVGEDAGLSDRLWAARETAKSVTACEGRTRASLYKALSLAYDFAVASTQNPDEYAELLEESGVKAQARAPMTPIVKLVFGIDYDKARLTEFAAALSYAGRQELEVGGFEDFVEKQPGGLKALVAAERQARRPETKVDNKAEVARSRLRTAPSISLTDIPGDEEFALVVTRRSAGGTHEAIAVIHDEALIERAIRRAL